MKYTEIVNGLFFYHFFSSSQRIYLKVPPSKEAISAQKHFLRIRVHCSLLSEMCCNSISLQAGHPMLFPLLPR